MNKKCDKCKDSIKGGSTVVSEGIAYNFCKSCTEILETFPNPSNIIHIFLTPDQRQSKADRNIFEARKRRAKGESVWK